MSIELGTVKSYDPHTMTVEIVSADGCEQHLSAGVMMNSFDPNGGGSFSAPVPGATCLYSKVSSEVILLGYYAPPSGDGGLNDPGVNDDTSNQSGLSTTSKTHISRSQSDIPTKSVFSGGSVTTTAGGLKTMLRDKMAGISITPIFYVVMNAINEFLDIMVTTFRFRSPAADVVVDAGDKISGSNPTQVNIVIRQTSAERAEGAIPAINLTAGKDTGSGVIDLKINNKNFVRIDLDRNTIVDADKLLLNANDIVVNAKTMTWNIPKIRYNTSEVYYGFGNGGMSFDGDNVVITSKDVTFNFDKYSLNGNTYNANVTTDYNIP